MADPTLARHPNSGAPVAVGCHTRHVTALDDTLTAIDTALDSCAQCNQPRGGSPSADFCSEDCQWVWLRSHTTNPGAVEDDVLSAETVEALKETFRQLRDAMATASQTMAESFREFGERLRRMQLDTLTVPSKESSAQRALRLQKTRNTGPRRDHHTKRGR